MGIFKNLFGKKDNPINSNEDFWNWFRENEKTFYKAIQTQSNIEKKFFDKLSSKLDQLREGYWFLAGMSNDTTAELVITADGEIKNIVFVEELVASAPKIDGWMFTALKPALSIEDVSIRMADLEFNRDNLFFYSNDNPEHPDEIDITVVHTDYQEDIKMPITNGTYIFLDNYLGELNFVTSIDEMQVIGKDQAEQELIPIEKLKDYLIWREKEFIEKYEGTRYDTENDNYQMLQATLENGNPLLAMINSELLNWDSKASHPWMMGIEIKYQGTENGMPDEDTYALMNIFEDELTSELKDADGYLNIGRQTADHSRDIFIACKDFRQPSKVLSKFQTKYKGNFEVNYNIFKDKYWQSMNRFRPDF